MERLGKFVKPGFKTMNSVLGSFPKMVPGVEFVKEYKERLEAALDAVEIAQDDREL